MGTIEKSAAFYLGRAYDPAQRRHLADQPILYDSRDLTTHAMCVGMTGSGKTGLCVDLLEEAALDGVPAIVIDPKGDMTNLLLTFPELRPLDFEPWVNIDDARRKEMTPSEYAETIAKQWAQGLEEWGQSGERIQRLRESAEFAIYTPGSEAGLPISVLHSFDAPSLSWEDDSEAIRELIANTVSALLGLLGIAADPMRSREHILLSHILEHHWRLGNNLDMALLIEAIQRPPVRKLGVFDVDTFYPEKERFNLAMTLNAIVASPSFAAWLKGVPLNIGQLTHTKDGRPRVSVFYIAHLSDTERMFFVTLLLEQLVGWMRQQSGTTSLRCLLYFDEIYGYFPPHPSNPPSKKPLMTLLKTARAFGLGVVLATQNPVDLDYKGLTNMGTWLIGKLQTDRDKARLLEGMEGIVSESGTMLDRGYLDRLISSLDSRVFILHNVHNERPQLFMTRWALSYLRGPLTRQQVRQLMAPHLEADDATEPVAVIEPEAELLIPSLAPEPQQPSLVGYTEQPPRIHARVAQYHLATVLSERDALQQLVVPSAPAQGAPSAHLVYQPFLLGMAVVQYADEDRRQTRSARVSCLLPLPEAHGLVPWNDCLTELDPRQLEVTPRTISYGIVPLGMTDSPPYTRLRGEFVDYIYREHHLAVWSQPDLGLRSGVNESEQDFRERCARETAARRSKETSDIRARYDRKLSQLRQRYARAQDRMQHHTIDFEGRKQEELASAGESILSLLLGKRRTSVVTRASQKRRLTAKAKNTMSEAQSTLSVLGAEIAALEREQDTELEATSSRWAPDTLRIEPAVLRPRKVDIQVEAFGLAWVPHWLLHVPDGYGNTRVEQIPAYRLPA